MLSLLLFSFIPLSNSISRLTFIYCTIRHCAPVSTQKAISIVPLSLLRRQFPLCPCLYSEGIQYKNNCRLAYRQLSSRDGTYIFQCHAMITIPFNISNLFIISITIFVTFHQHNISFSQSLLYHISNPNHFPIPCPSINYI